MEPQRYASYLVRLWLVEKGNDHEEPSNWNGELIHIQSGRSWRFDDLEHLLETLRDFTTGEEP